MATVVTALDPHEAEESKTYVEVFVPEVDDADNVETGPSDEQLPGVFQQAVCGDDDPPLCEYEKLRERNIKEMAEAMRETLAEIGVAKQDLRDNAPGVKKRAAPAKEEECGVVRDWQNAESVVVDAKRERNPVCFVVENDIKERSRERGRVKDSRRAQRSSPFRKRRGKIISKADFHSSRDSSHNLRPRNYVNYSEVPEPEVDGFIWCSSCNRKKYNGCEEHSPYFGDNKEFTLEVEKSSMGKKSGDGIFNRGKVIPKGVLFGPYSGRFISSAAYKKMEQANKESGNAWEIHDKFNMKTVGYIDPGVNPDPELHWMAKINCPNKTSEQNLIAFQLAGQIYYRVKENILWGEELLVWYGRAYAVKIGINLKTVEQYTRKEDHTKGASVCGYCHTGMEGERELEEHLVKGDNHAYKCGMKQAMEMVRMTESGQRKYVCKVCGKGFKTNASLTMHKSVHAKQKGFMCDVDGCDKAYTRSSDLKRHKKIVHKGSFYECPECGKRFGQKITMTKHYETVHEEKKQFKCAVCGVQFSQKDSLARHTKTVHDRIRSFKCEHCNQSFGESGNRNKHMEIVHYNIRYPCTWQGCTHQAYTKTHLKYHIRRAHTKEWSLECHLCENQLDTWWGCIHPSEMAKHKVMKHPVEWEEEQELYRRDHPFICSIKGCLNRYKTKMEMEMHELKLH